MCVRMCPLTLEEAQAVLDARATPGAHAIRYIERPDPLRDARPGSIVPVYVPEGGGLAVARLTWGFPLDGKPNAVFNTRIESALEQLRLGRRGMWAMAIAEGRCLVPVRAFYEGHATERVASEKTGKPVKRQYLFRLPGARAFLLAAVREGDRFSIVTTRPNASVAPIHDRMPLVLGPGESSVWLGPGFAALADRNQTTLLSRPSI
ncbi:SOS response-associated peptidase family protein [Thermophilibacter mediterraneus]|uniref:SOS response-associated peptidase family protein n=1 Tax=Thermophilibacter mediterraneus TaxID=1871031 RepID=UPI000931A8F6|nr:SOS response-associated peptidase family protein [Thermophilibacter mediterraneus]